MAKVLVTRPAGQAQALCERLRAAGFHPVHQPMLKIRGCAEPAAEQRQRLMELDQYQWVIFVSGNAVKFGMNWIEQFWPQLPLGINWYTVGSGSAEALSAHGLAVNSPQRMDSEGLLAEPALQSLNGEKVLIVKGEGGRNLLQQRLRERGAKVDLLSAYQRLPPDLAAQQLKDLFEQHSFAAVLISSGEGLTNMLSLLGERAVAIAADSRVVVPGQRVAELAAESGFRRIAVSENATDEAMLRALQGAMRE
ncbi:MAG: uroporphyrinogen-III synthase [Halieaceae bacterium]|nr:uroporphyrinogen-III synthase [Halieaceae bacterium]